MCVLIMIMCVCMYVYNVWYYVSVVFMCRCMRVVYVCVHISIYGCVRVTCWCASVVACCSVSDSFVRSELGNGRFGFVPVMNLIDWRFED